MTKIYKVGFELEGEWTEEGKDTMSELGLKVVHDGSISSCCLPYEREMVTKPFVNVDILQKYLDRVGELEKKKQYHYNSTMGFHIHISFVGMGVSNNMPFEIWSTQFNRYFLNKLEVAFPAVWEARHDNRYCVAKKQRHDITWRGQSRYQAINYCAYEKHGTVEFRIWPAGKAVDMKKYLAFTIDTVNAFLLLAQNNLKMSATEIMPQAEATSTWSERIELGYSNNSTNENIEIQCVNWQS